MSPEIEAREVLRDALRQVAIFGESDAACDVADAALESLNVVYVVDALAYAGRYHNALQLAYVSAVRSGVFDVA